MPLYRHPDTVYLHNLIKVMEHHMHKQLFLHQCEMYIVVSHSKQVAELQMHWNFFLFKIKFPMSEFRAQYLK